MALVAVVERALERVPGAASPPPAAAPPTPPAALGLLLRGLLVRSLFLHRDLLRLRLLLRLECGCDQRLVLGAKVGLLLRRGGEGAARNRGAPLGPRVPQGGLRRDGAGRHRRLGRRARAGRRGARAAELAAVGRQDRQPTSREGASNITTVTSTLVATIARHNSTNLTVPRL